MTPANKYPFIFVHGMFGWGDAIGINNSAPYWGGSTGSLMDFLNSCNYECYSASVGPISSAWDNACELYAQLTGTRVDYGEAHSKAHGHKRYGRTYSKVLCQGFGERKFHLIGHSHGGQVIRLLAHLLAKGDEREKSVTDPADISPLFTGGKEDFIASITCICTPHNGSTLYEVAKNYNFVTPISKLSGFVMGAIGRTSIHGKHVDYQFEQFGLTPVKGEFEADSIIASIRRLQSSGEYVIADLSIEGAYKLNEFINVSKNIYYFSYPANGCSAQTHMPDNIRFPFLRLFSRAMRQLTFTEEYGAIKLDKTWIDNDGLVNTVSARCPFDEPAKDFDGKAEKGIWNIMPTLICDHGMATGLLADKKKLQGSYINLSRMLMKLENE